MELKLPETGPAKATYFPTLPKGGQGALGNLHTTHTTLTFSRREARTGQEATESAKNTKPHMVLRVTPHVHLKYYPRTNTQMLRAHHMPL